MRALITVFAKEFLENLRDRRTLISALLFGPLFGPILFGAMVSRMLNQSVVESDEPLHLSISGSEHAPGLVGYLQSQGVKLAFTPLSESGARTAVRSGAEQVVLIVPAEYGQRFTAALPAPVLLVADSADSQARKSADRARLLLAGYGSGIAQLRLQIRGVSPLLAVPIAVNEIDVATPTGRAVVVLGFMTYFVLFAVLMGGLYLAIDSTAGERERGSLEALLSLPVARGSRWSAARCWPPVPTCAISLALEPDGLRAGVPVRAAGAARHECQPRGWATALLFFVDLPALHSAWAQRLMTLRGLVHPHLPRSADLPDHGAARAHAADRLRQHLLAQDPAVR